MSLSTSVQKYQLLRIVDPDGTVDSDDQRALLGITQGASYELSSAQKKQLLRLAVPDGTVTTSDKFAFLGYMEAQNPSTDITEFFSVDWTIDSTLTGRLLPVTNTGAFSIVLEDVQGGLIGRVVNPAVREVIEEEVTGGWAGINQHLSWEQREKKRKKDASKRYKKPRWVLGPNGWTRADN